MNYKVITVARAANGAVRNYERPFETEFAAMYMAREYKLDKNVLCVFVQDMTTGELCDTYFPEEEWFNE